MKPETKEYINIIQFVQISKAGNTVPSKDTGYPWWVGNHFHVFPFS